MIQETINCFFAFLQSNADGLGVLGAIFGGAFALWEYHKRRVAERQALAVERYEKFKNSPDVVLATTMLDWTGNLDIGVDDKGKPITAEITDQYLESALGTDVSFPYDQAQKRTRYIFDSFLTELDVLGGMVKSGLLKLGDLEPFVKYWLDIIGGERHMKKRPRAAAQLRKYIAEFSFENVQFLVLCQKFSGWQRWWPPNPAALNKCWKEKYLQGEQAKSAQGD